MKKLFLFITLIFPVISFAQNSAGAASSGAANEVATNSQRAAIEYANAGKAGPKVVVASGEIKSANANFTQKITSNAIADFGELELGRANFKITKKVENAAFTIKFDILKAEMLGKAGKDVDGSAVGNLVGGITGAVVGSVKTKDSAEVWNIALRWQAIDKSGDQIGTGLVEDRMELGAKGTAILGVSSDKSGGPTLDTMIQYLVQKAVAEIDKKMK